MESLLKKFTKIQEMTSEEEKKCSEFFRNIYAHKNIDYDSEFIDIYEDLSQKLIPRRAVPSEKKYTDFFSTLKTEELEEFILKYSYYFDLVPHNAMLRAWEVLLGRGVTFKRANFYLTYIGFFGWLCEENELEEYIVLEEWDEVARLSKRLYELG